MQQAEGVQLLQPLAILDVALAAGHGFQPTRIDEANNEPSRFQHFKQRNPVDTGGFQRHGRDGVLLQPVGNGIKILRERFKPPDHRIAAVGARNGHKVVAITDIDSCSPWVNHIK